MALVVDGSALPCVMPDIEVIAKIVTYYERWQVQPLYSLQIFPAQLRAFSAERSSLDELLLHGSSTVFVLVDQPLMCIVADEWQECTNTPRGAGGTAGTTAHERVREL